jgi:hypothetical protein
MAALSKNGTEVARFTKTLQRETYTIVKTISIRSTGTVLEKNDFQHPDATRNHSSGWKHWGGKPAKYNIPLAQQRFADLGWSRV